MDLVTPSSDLVWDGEMLAHIKLHLGRLLKVNEHVHSQFYMGQVY